ncbi:septum formation initiator family protein [Tenacibaculum sp. UWU-22]|uniref:FtsB family cell division protein n=1 Tax=Tenacibaculum sp. UWU-22 TaxID=3234187 RepID=UPI0034DB5126
MKLKKRIKIFGVTIGTFYIVSIIVFIIWMTFIDKNSYLVHQEYNTEISDLEKSIEFYQKKINEDNLTIKKLQDSLELERYAREKYLMKKENEDVYLIDFDTIKK